MWLLYALLSPLLWAMVHLLDWHCVTWMFKQPWMGVITSSLASCIVFLILPFAWSDIFSNLPDRQMTALALATGVLIQVSQAFYFQSLAYSEAGIVAAYWNITPTLLPIASLLLFDEVLYIKHYLGIGTLVLASVGFCLIDTSFKTRWKSFSLMFVASCLQAVALLVEDYVFKHSSFVASFFFITVGIILIGLTPLLLHRVRRTLSQTLNTARSGNIVAVLVGIEAVNLLALLLSQRAIDLGIPSLVAAVETTIPAHTFILSALMFSMTQRFGDSRSLLRLRLKIALLVVMIIGIWLVS
jgi:drug/metabolite transporter (DMT)-like permease